MLRLVSAFVAVLLLVCAAPARGAAPLVASDELAGPFSYFAESSDVVGFKDAPEGFQLINDGSLLSGFGQFSLAAGDPPRAMDVRVKTLHKDSLPIFEYGFRRDGVDYAFRAWGLTPGLDPQEPLVAYVEATVRNPGAAPAVAGLQADFGPIREGHRKPWPCAEWYRDRFLDAQVYAADGPARVADGQAWRAGHLVFAYSGTPKAEADGAAVTYQFELTPGAAETVEFRIPYVPIAEAHKPHIEQVGKLTFAAAFAQAEGFWQGVLARALQIDLPEPQVVDSQQPGLCYLLCALDVDATGRQFIQRVNEFQYDHFYPRDSAYIIRVYDMYGLHDIARQTLQSYLVRGEDGAVQTFLRMKQHPDDWGQSLWTLGAHFRTTGDVEFAREVLPGIAPHLDDFESSIGGDPLGLWPVAGPYDNELIDGHYTGHNFWAVLGLGEVANLARAAGDTALADRAEKLLAAFRPVLLKRLEMLTAQTEGYIPPGLDDPAAGYDWENATGGVYPFGVLPPDHPWAQATVRTVREYKWREGIATWGPNGWLLKQKSQQGGEVIPGSLHHYQTFNTTEAMLAMGMQREVLEDLYCVLVHTSSTHAGFELGMQAWGTRDPGGNFPPHGWFAARYCELLRNMLVREEGGVLHLASALSPRWVRPGDVIRVTGAPTNFGPLSMTLHSLDDGAELTLESKWRAVPEKLVFHVPWFLTIESAEATGVSVDKEKGLVMLPPDCGRCRLHWTWKESPDLSYERAVHLWLSKQYDARPETDRHFLFPRPVRPLLMNVHRIFTDAYELRLASGSGVGVVFFTLDGRDPTLESPRYERPVPITDTTTVRAIEVWPDGRTSEPAVITLAKVTCREPDAPLTAADRFVPGVILEVWDGVFRKLADFLGTPPAETRPVAHADLREAGRDKPFGARYTGYLRVPADGVYAITVGSDDGSALWLGDDLVVDNDGHHVYTEVTGERALRAGYHRFTLGYFEGGGAHYLRLFWAGPDGQRRPMPAEAFVREK